MSGHDILFLSYHVLNFITICYCMNTIVCSIIIITSITIQTSASECCHAQERIYIYVKVFNLVLCITQLKVMWNTNMLYWWNAGLLWLVWHSQTLQEYGLFLVHYLCGWNVVSLCDDRNNVTKIHLCQEKFHFGTNYQRNLSTVSSADFFIEIVISDCFIKEY